MAYDAAAQIHEAGERVLKLVDDLLDEGLSSEWSAAASELYKEQFEKKENPYGEGWEPRPGDDRRKSSPYFGKVTSVDRDGFALRVAAPNGARSCVPFEPRGLGRWKKDFDELLHERLQRLSSGKAG